MCGVTRKDRLHNEHIKWKLTDSSNKGENQRMMFEMIWAYTQKTKTNPRNCKTVKVYISKELGKKGDNFRHQMEY